MTGRYPQIDDETVRHLCISIFDVVEPETLGKDVLLLTGLIGVQKHHLHAHLKVFAESTLPLEVQMDVQVQVGADFEIDYDHNYYKDLGVAPNDNHDSINRAYNSKFKLWSPFSVGGKQRWRDEIFNQARYRYRRRLRYGRSNEGYRRYRHRKVAQNWAKIEKAGKVLLIPENRIRYDAVRAELGADPEIPMEFDIAGRLEDRNENAGGGNEGEGDNARDSDSMIVMWCGRSGKKSRREGALHLHPKFR